MDSRATGGSTSPMEISLIFHI